MTSIEKYQDGVANSLYHADCILFENIQTEAKCRIAVQVKGQAEMAYAVRYGRNGANPGSLIIDSLGGKTFDSIKLCSPLVFHRPPSEEEPQVTLECHRAIML